MTQSQRLHEPGLELRFHDMIRSRMWRWLLVTAFIPLACVYAQEPDSLAASSLTSSPPPSLVSHVPAGFLQTEAIARPRIGLALSGGGARGLAHIGVLQVLEEEGIPVDHICGTSMGAIVGGMRAMGYSPDEMERIVRGLEWSNLFSDAPSRRNLFLAQKENSQQELLTIRFRDGRPYIPDAFVNGQTLYQTLLRISMQAPLHARGGRFVNLEVPLSMVLTDLNSGERVLLDQGDVTLAMRGAMAVPIVFRPLAFQGKLLVDGGAVENIPVRATREAGVDFVIAVDAATPDVATTENDELWEIANQVTTLMTVTNDSISRSFADILITPEIRNVGNTDFDQVIRIIEAGRRGAREKLPEIRQLLGSLPEPLPDSVFVQRIVLGGLEGTQYQRVMQMLEPYDNSYTTRETINQKLKRILSFLHNQELGAATLHAELREDGALVVAVSPGIVHEIRIEGIPGNENLPVRREIRLREGEPLNTRRLQHSLTQLYATGRYSTVYSYLSPHDDGGVVLHLLLEPAPTPKISLGLGFDSDRKGRYFAEFGLFGNVLRQGEELVIRGKYGVRDRQYTLAFTAHRIASTYIGITTGAEVLKRERDLFFPDHEVERVVEYRTTRGFVDAMFNMQTWGTISAGVRAERVRDNIITEWNTLQLNGLQLRAALDTEDRKPFPRRGARVEAQYDSYLEWLGSERSFNRFQALLELVAPLHHRFVLRTTWSGSVADLTTPSSHRFSLGGMTMFPAFKQDRFVALRRVNTTLALRYDLISRYIADAYLISRFDIAAFSDDEDWRPTSEDLLFSYSAGFALDTFLGPLELWYSYAPESNAAPSNTRISVNLGYRF